MLEGLRLDLGLYPAQPLLVQNCRVEEMTAHECNQA